MFYFIYFNYSGWNGLARPCMQVVEVFHGSNYFLFGVGVEGDLGKL